MAQYTNLSKQDVSTIFEKFQINNIHSYKILTGGSQNTNYQVSTESGKYVLTICEQHTIEKTIELAKLLEHLKVNNFKTSKIVRTADNELISNWNGKPAMVKEFLNGKVIEDLPNHLIELIGTELAKLNKIPPPDSLQKQVGYGKETFNDVKKYADNSEFEFWLNRKLELFSPYFEIDLPKAFIHADLFANNVIISDDETSATIMDFEEAAHYYRVFDIGMAILGICKEEKVINLEKAHHLLKGYQKETQLLEIEKEALHPMTIYAATAMTFWRHKNFNYTVPTPKMFNHYLGLKVLADFIEEQPTDCFFPKKTD